MIRYNNDNEFTGKGNLKINIIIPSFFPAVIYGGPIFSSLNACKELSRLDELEICVSTTNTNMYSRLDVKTNQNIKFEDNFYVKYYNETIVDKFSFALFLNVWRDIKRSDIVHIQYIFNTPVPISLLYAKLFNKPVLLSTRGNLCKWCLRQGSKLKKSWLTFLIKPFANSIYWHATATEEKDDILSIFPNAKVEIIPNGIYCEQFKHSNQLSKQVYIEKFTNTKIDVDKIIVSMGRLHKKKGFDILIDAFLVVLKVYPNAKLLIAGDDEGEKENLIAQIQKNNLIDKVFLVGNIQDQDKIDFLANADLFVLPSYNENFGNVYIESLASGTPIVASTSTPWEEVEEYNCGKWVDNTIAETANAIMIMLDKNRDEMRVNSLKLAKNYDWKNIASKFKDLYEKMRDEHEASKTQSI